MHNIWYGSYIISYYYASNVSVCHRLSPSHLHFLLIHIFSSHLKDQEMLFFHFLMVPWYQSDFQDWSKLRHRWGLSAFHSPVYFVVMGGISYIRTGLFINIWHATRCYKVWWYWRHYTCMHVNINCWWRYRYDTGNFFSLYQRYVLQPIQLKIGPWKGDKSIKLIFMQPWRESAIQINKLSFTIIYNNPCQWHNNIIEPNEHHTDLQYQPSLCLQMVV